jgi:hypothetical protein
MDEMVHTSHRKEPRNLSKESSNSKNRAQIAIEVKFYRADNPVSQGPDNPPTPTKYLE